MYQIAKEQQQKPLTDLLQFEEKIETGEHQQIIKNMHENIVQDPFFFYLAPKVSVATQYHESDFLNPLDPQNMPIIATKQNPVYITEEEALIKYAQAFKHPLDYIEKTLSKESKFADKVGPNSFAILSIVHSEFDSKNPQDYYLLHHFNRKAREDANIEEELNMWGQFNGVSNKKKDNYYSYVKRKFLETLDFTYYVEKKFI